MTTAIDSLYTMLLWQFCDTYVGRYALFAPWTEGNVTYASDGRRAICVDSLPCPPWTTDITNVKRPDVAGIFSKQPWDWVGSHLPLISRRITIEAGEVGDYDIDQLSYYDEIVVGKQLFNRELIYWVTLIPNVRVSFSGTALLFKSERCRGIVMAIQKDSEPDQETERVEPIRTEETTTS